MKKAYLIALLAVAVGAFILWYWFLLGTADIPPPWEPVKVPRGFVLIKPGTFFMGSVETEAGREQREGPRHEVVLTRPFILKKTEVTRGEFARFVAASGHKTGAEERGVCLTGNGEKKTRGASWKAPGFTQADHHPVVCVDWFDALAYANWLSGKQGLTRCYDGARWIRGCSGYRLPTEAEWEYAARGGTTSALPGGELTSLRCEKNARLDDMGWYCGNAGGETHSVAQMMPNSLGLHDMHGNAWEWVWDVFEKYGASRATDPTGPVADDDSPVGEEQDRVVRGGGWGSHARLCRSAYRDGDEPRRAFDNLGFRLARSAPAGAGRVPGVAALQAHLKKNPNDVGANYRLAQAYLAGKRYSEAEAAALRAMLVAKAPGNFLLQGKASLLRTKILTARGVPGSVDQNQVMFLDYQYRNRIGSPGGQPGSSGPGARQRQFMGLSSEPGKELLIKAADDDAKRYYCPYETLGLAFLTFDSYDLSQLKGDLPRLTSARRPGKEGGLARLEQAPAPRDAAGDKNARDRLAGLDLKDATGAEALRRIGEHTGAASVLRISPRLFCQDETLAALNRLGHRRYSISFTDGGFPAGKVSCLQRLRAAELHLRFEQADDSVFLALAGLKNLVGLDLTGAPVTDAGLEQLKRHGRLRSLSLKYTDVSDRGLRHLSGLKRLETLNLWGTTVTDKGLAHLAGLGALRQLNLGSTRVGAEGLDAVSRLSRMQSLELYDLKLSDEALSKLAGLGALVKLGLGGTGISDGGVARLARLTNLAQLDLASTEVTDRGLAAVAKLQRLTGLGLGGTQITDAGLRHVGAMKQLRVLYLGHTKIKGPGLAHLATLQHLTHLVLGGTTINGRSLESLAGLNRLRVLELWHSPVSDVALKHISSLGALERLALGATMVTDAGLAHLTGLRRLRSLELWKTNISDAGLAYLAGLGSLRALDLKHTNVGDGGLVHVARLSMLADLELGDTRITDKGLARLGGLSRLRRLGLRGTNVGDAALKRLSGLRSLRALHLGFTRVGDQGLAALSGLTALEDLDLRGTAITDAGMAHLQKLTALSRLWLDGTGVGDRGLAHVTACASLQELGLSRTRITDQGLKHLAGLSRLRVLNLSGVGLAGPGLKWISRAQSMHRLQLRNTRLTDAGLRHVATLRALKELDLGGTMVTGVGFNHLVGLNDLGMLDLSNSPVGDQGLHHLLKLKSLYDLRLTASAISDRGLKVLAGLPSIITMELGGTNVTDRGVRHLASNKVLEELELWFTRVSDTGLKSLARVSSLSRLQLHGLAITDAGLKHLKKAESLEELGLSATRVTRKAMDRFQKDNPDVEISGKDIFVPPEVP